MHRILDSMASPVVVSDAHMKIVFVNPNTCEVFGFSSDELIGRDVTVLMTDQDRSSHNQYVQRYRDKQDSKIIGKRPRLVTGRHKDGSQLKLYLSITVNDDGGFTAVFTDVTGQLRQADRMHRILSTMASPVVESDAAMKIRYVNPNACEVFGFSSEELIGQDVTVLMNEQDGHNHNEYVHRYRSTNHSKIIGKRPRLVTGRHKDGSDLKLYLTITTSDDGGFTAVFTDVTEQIRAENRVATVMSDAKVEKARLEAQTYAERALNDYIAHEVRNPLSVSISACRFLSANSALDEIKDQAARQLIGNDIDLILSSLSYISELLTDMLDLNKFMQTGSCQLSRTRISILQDVLQPVQSMLHWRFGRATIHLECPKDLWVEADPLRLKQVLVNLAKNSLKFVEEGYIKLIAFRDIHNQDNVVIVVEDSGPGIPELQRATLFEKFQESLDMLRQGTGIGLSLVKAIVEALGGTIRLDPAYHSSLPSCPGARFEIRLPLPEVSPPTYMDNMESESTSKALSSISGQILAKLSGKILVVDDDATVRKMIVRKLQCICPQTQVEEAASGEVAIRIVQQDVDSFIFALVDHYMPGPGQPLTGEETILTLRKISPSMSIFGCSANDVSERHVAAGADGFFRKPLPSMSTMAVALVEHMRLPSNLVFLIIDDEPVNYAIFARHIKQMAPSSKVVHAQNAIGLNDLVSLLAPDIVILDENFVIGPSGSEALKNLRELNFSGLIVSWSGSSLNPSSQYQYDLVWTKPLPETGMMKRQLWEALVSSPANLPNVN